MPVWVIATRVLARPTPANDFEVSEVAQAPASRTVYRCCFTVVGLPLNSLAAFITMKAGFVIRSCAFNSRKAEPYDTKQSCVYVRRIANSQGDSSGDFGARLMICVLTVSGIRFHTEKGLDRICANVLAYWGFTLESDSAKHRKARGGTQKQDR